MRGYTLINGSKIRSEVISRKRRDKIRNMFQDIEANISVNSSIGKIVYGKKDDYKILIDYCNNCRILLSNDEKTILKVEIIESFTPAILVIPSSVEEIADYACCNKSVNKEGDEKISGIGLIEVGFPKKSVKHIGEYAFYGNKLKRFISPDSVESMGTYALAKNIISDFTISKNQKVLEPYTLYKNSIMRFNSVNLEQIKQGALRNNLIDTFSYGNKLKSIEKDGLSHCSCNIRIIKVQKDCDTKLLLENLKTCEMRLNKTGFIIHNKNKENFINDFKLIENYNINAIDSERNKRLFAEKIPLHSVFVAKSAQGFDINQPVRVLNSEGIELDNKLLNSSLEAVQGA